MSQISKGYRTPLGKVRALGSAHNGADEAWRLRLTSLAMVPLTIAFVADDGTIVNLADMAARSDESHCSAKPVRYVLEMNQGWFAKKGISAGTKLTGRPFNGS